jgi:hypothetical protein
MNPDASHQKNPPARLPQHEGAAPKANQHAQPANVPVFNCIVYVSPDPSGGVRARVANLAGLDFTAANERGALAKIVAAFKQRVGDLTRDGIPIPWIEPPTPAETGEQTRFIPVHL